LTIIGKPQACARLRPGPPRHETRRSRTVDPQLRACIETELATLPGAHLIERKGRVFLKGKNGFEILVEKLCAVKRQWLELVEHPTYRMRTSGKSSACSSAATDMIAYLIVTLSYRAFRKQDESICGRRLRSRCAR